jgi:hypothetical protein
MYKMTNNIAPPYLLDLLPETVGNQVSYGLRNNNAIRAPFARTESFRRSVIPLAINEWNKLPAEVQGLPTLEAFISAMKPKPQKLALYYFGERFPAIHHARTRLECSKLNAHLCLKLHVTLNPVCQCGYEMEDPMHYYLHCPLYINERIKMNTVISNLTNISLHNILFGDPDLDLSANKIIFEAVHTFILETNRFAN